MNLEELSQLPLYQLEKELQKRKNDSQVELDKKAKEQKVKKYLERPTCDILGRAYTGEFSDYELARFNVVGNSGHTYSFKAKVPSTVHTYLNNVFSWNGESEMENAMKLLMKAFLAKRLNDPVVILELIGLCSSNSILDSSLAKEDFEKAVIDRMKVFSNDEILNCDKSSGICHGSEYLDLIKKSRGITNKIRSKK